MKRLAYLAAMVVVALPLGRAAVAQQMDQRKIIAVRPAIPEATKRWMEQEKKDAELRRRQQERERFNQALFGWMKKRPSRPAAAGNTAAGQPSGRSFWDIFNPARWGKPRPAPDANQQLLQNSLRQNQLPGQNRAPAWNQQGGTQPLTGGQPGGDQPPGWNQPGPGQGQPPFGQMPPPNVPAPASQPG